MKQNVNILTVIKCNLAYVGALKRTTENILLLLLQTQLFHLSLQVLMHHNIYFLGGHVKCQPMRVP